MNNILLPAIVVVAMTALAIVPMLLHRLPPVLWRRSTPKTVVEQWPDGPVPPHLMPSFMAFMSNAELGAPAGEGWLDHMRAAASLFMGLCSREEAREAVDQYVNAATGTALNRIA